MRRGIYFELVDPAPCGFFWDFHYRASDASLWQTGSNSAQKIMVQYKSWVFRLFYQGASEVGEAGSPLLIQRFRHPRIEEEGGRRRELAYSTLFSTVGFLGCTTSPSKCGAQ